MTTDIKELVKRLRVAEVGEAFLINCGSPELQCTELGLEAADALEALAGEVERLTTNGVHSCHDECQRPLCKSYREIVAAKKHGELLNKMLGEAEAERDRLKAALEWYGDKRNWNAVKWTDNGQEYEAVPVYDDQGYIARKALGDAS